MKEMKGIKENWRKCHTISHSSDPWHKLNNMKNANAMKNFIFKNWSNFLSEEEMNQKLKKRLLWF